MTVLRLMVLRYSVCAGVSLGGGGGAPATGQFAFEGAPGICTIALIAMSTSALDRRAYRSCGAMT